MAVLAESFYSGAPSRPVKVMGNTGEHACGTKMATGSMGV